MNRTERIRERAYLLWERGDRSKHESHYWFQAEREIDTDNVAPKSTAGKAKADSKPKPKPKPAAKAKPKSKS